MPAHRRWDSEAFDLMLRRMRMEAKRGEQERAEMALRAAQRNGASPLGHEPAEPMYGHGHFG